MSYKIAIQILLFLNEGDCVRQGEKRLKKIELQNQNYAFKGLLTKILLVLFIYFYLYLTSELPASCVMHRNFHFYKCHCF